ncbi:MAG: DUF86 domain-containing protein [Candidatus Aminicenantes bacterium]|nr:DUF86 domain-containing protein [Candidatus Aminicenantes bacterium]NIM78494.1 DUF86 domain-containing protein [Candidatus Aminicenantes bacterium]NIN19915.1 DUF86 domain-containing protein [Candidatus Aminicenantes bacterium]NIN41632.1 DUF86 domain-containing protein [Candidatus Aminicenantes bacterium]NIN86541.1 DUF86 domain-containing protein [Candidatus Aminicenantes bacterium]
MTQESEDRFIRHLNFLEEELKDYTKFKKLTREEYLKKRDKRRNVERWVENLINSTVDICRMILNIEGMAVPDTYRATVSMISTVGGLEEVGADKLSKWVRFRNIVAHEYLDIKWNSIKKFIDETETLYKNFVVIIKQYVKSKQEAEQEEE